jgi:hypothetical protein
MSNIGLTIHSRKKLAFLKYWPNKRFIYSLAHFLLTKGEIMEVKKEERAIVLDFLPNGYPFDKRPIHLKTPIAQVLGIEHFALLEVG